MRVSVIICAYSMDRWPALLAALESIYEQTMCPHEIILVIDHQSKSLVARFVGARTGLSIEWPYVLKILPLGEARDLLDVVRRGDSWCVAQVAAT